MKKEQPKFRNEEEERNFWSSHDSTDYVDWGKAKRTTFPNLRPTMRSISLRLPQSMLDMLKVLANKKDVPYQSLLKIFLADRIQKEFGSPHP